MPTITRIGPYRVFFYSNEGYEPPHVHIQRERRVAKFWLTPVAQASASSFAAHELRELEQMVFTNRHMFLEVWNEFFDRRS
jgi:hypothetical protein